MFFAELMDLAKTKRLSELSELEGAQPTPYILQILSLLLELSPVPISPLYADLFPRLLLVVLWERKSNVPALIRIVQAYLRKVWGRRWGEGDSGRRKGREEEERERSGRRG